MADVDLPGTPLASTAADTAWVTQSPAAGPGVEMAPLAAASAEISPSPIAMDTRRRSDLEEELESLRERCEALEARNGRLLDEVAVLRSRAEVDAPHWAQELRAWRLRMEEIIAPFFGAPLGERLREVNEGLCAVEAGLRGMGGTALRDELVELRRAFAEYMSESANREEGLVKENERLRASATPPALGPLCPAPGQRRPLVIGLCGPSGSGKSTLAGALADQLPAGLLREEPEFFRLPKVPYAQKDKRYEEPSNIDWDAAGKALSRVIAETEHPCVIVEHYLLLAEVSSLLPQIDCCLFLDPLLRLTETEAARLCCERRVGRGERTTQEAEDLRTYYHDCVWPCYKEHSACRIEAALALERIRRLDAAADPSATLAEALEVSRSWLEKHTAPQ